MIKIENRQFAKIQKPEFMQIADFQFFCKKVLTFRLTYAIIKSWKGNTETLITVNVESEENKMTSSKDFSFYLKVKTTDGKIESRNVTNTARGYRQSWFKTPQAAIKGLKNSIAISERCHDEIVEAYCFTRSGKRF